jgi:hypothetical protein
LLNPQSVRTVARHCQRLFDVIAERVDG